MVIKKLDQVARETISEKGVQGVQKQVLLSPEDGAPNFTLRRFIVKPGGYTYFHTHDFEHEVYILSGQGIIRTEDRELSISRDQAVLVVPNEVHQFINPYEEELTFLCIIPNI